jgi:hypothetical protein
MDEKIVMTDEERVERIKQLVADLNTELAAAAFAGIAVTIEPQQKEENPDRAAFWQFRYIRAWKRLDKPGLITRPF